MFSNCSCPVLLLLPIIHLSPPLPIFPARNDGRDGVLTLSHMVQKVLIELTASSRQEKSQTSRRSRTQRKCEHTFTYIEIQKKEMGERRQDKKRDDTRRGDKMRDAKSHL